MTYPKTLAGRLRPVALVLALAAGTTVAYAGPAQATTGVVEFDQNTAFTVPAGATGRPTGLYRPASGVTRLV
ncbi:hypothetical protein [Kitasatospora sp. NPDC094011]|uniref:hypothetical protein n=1 Tax=Kitasatospora sp. NPDC094011 TaxID=3364090 RepID=UPI0037F4F465